MRDTKLGSPILEINLHPKPKLYTLQTPGELRKKVKGMRQPGTAARQWVRTTTSGVKEETAAG